MGYRSKTSRFHKLTGPASLFERTEFIMGKKNGLNLQGSHFKQRCIERNVSDLDVGDFNTKVWELMTVDVNIKKGKFIASSWRKLIGEHYLWISIGTNQEIMTVVWDRCPHPSKDIITQGPLFIFTDEVNIKLMQSEEKNNDVQMESIKSNLRVDP